MTADHDTENSKRVVETKLRGDAATIDPMLTADFTYTHATTAIADSREQWLDIFRTANRRYRAYDVRDLSCRMYPGTAIVFGTGHQEIIRPSGEEIELNTTFTCVWVQVEGDWQLACWQATRIP
jgi:hypothetical protein